MTHPLTENPKWIFSQPNIRIDAHYTATSGDDTQTVKTFVTGETCRETLIYNIRQHFRAAVCYKKQSGWSLAHHLEKNVQLGTEEANGAGMNSLVVVAEKSIPWPAKSSAQLIQLADYLLGPICVLLDPERPKGDWWSRGPEAYNKAERSTRWSGTTNWFLIHPVTVAIISGLYRQCYQLVLAGEAEKIISLVDSEEIEEVLTECSQKKALTVLKKTRPWIEVPVAQYGNRRNYVFPMKTWRRLIRLQRAIRRHSYHEVFEQGFAEGWQLDTSAGPEDGEYDGLFGFWGDDDDLTDEHRHLMKLGAPRRKKSAGK